MNGETFPFDWKVMIRGLGILAILVALGFFLKKSGLGETLDTAWIDSEIKGGGLRGELLFVAAAAILTALGLPRQVIAFWGGYAFDVYIGTGLAALGTACGCALTVFHARLIGRAFVRRRFPGRIKRIDDFLSENAFSMTLLIRLLPVGNNLATNLGAGVSGVSAPIFIAASALGYLPQTMIFALVGSGVNLNPIFRIGLGSALLVVSGTIGVRLHRKYRRGKSIDEEIDRDPHPDEETPDMENEVEGSGS